MGESFQKRKGAHFRELSPTGVDLRLYARRTAPQQRCCPRITLKDDLLPSLDAISEYTGEPVRRLRHIIAVHGFPAKKVGGKIQSRKSWVNAYYAEPDRRASGNGGE